MPKSAEIPVGSRFSFWRVIGPPHKKGKDFAYLCRCECLHQAVVAGTLLRAGRSRGCRRCTNKGKKRPDIRKPLGEAARNEAIGCYRRNASRRGISFTLGVEACEMLFRSNCYFCGAPPSNVMKKRGMHGTFTYNGIDRLDNAKGYFLGNAVACCFNCNRAKGDRSTEEFLAWVRTVFERRSP